jgi:iron complex outermembrane recepter protein
VTRGTPNAGQTVGPIVLLDTTNINAPEISTSSYNLKLDYTLRTNALGRFDFSTIASSWQHFRQQTTIGGAVVEQLNNPNTTVVNSSVSLGLAKFKGTFGLDWSKGPFTAGWMTRYVSPYTIGSRFGIAGTFPTQGTVDGWVSSQIYHDAYFGVKLGRETRESSWWRHALSDTSVQLGVRNVFNKAPPFDALGGVTQQWYSTYGDARLASYYINVKRAF